MQSALVVLSGGLDSTTVLADAMNVCANVEVVTFDYGQKHATEIQAARHVADHYGVLHHTIHIPHGILVGGALTGDVEMPHLTYEELAASEGPSPTYVPYRNGTMLSIAAGLALSRELESVWAGMHAEDAHNWAYPDCTPEFIGAQAAAIYIGSYGKVRLVAPLQNLTKAEVVMRGLALQAPLHLTLSCYEGTVPACGKCPTCIGRLEAFSKIGATDPIAYA